MSSITSANSGFVITPRLLGAFSGLLPAIAGVGIQIEGYASDDAFVTEAVDTAEVRIGVDGKKSQGWLPHLIPQVITLQADSVTIPLFDAMVGSQNALRETIALDGVLTLPAVNKSYTLTNGTLRRYVPIPPGKKVLEPVTYDIVWESAVAVPLA